MKLMSKIGTFVAIGALVGACAQTTLDETGGNGPKPEADPDSATLDGNKADGLTDYYTTIMGHLALGEGIKEQIAYPDWFHGYTLDLTEGQTIRFELSATEDGYVRLYGPATSVVDGEPRFDRAAAAGDTDPDGDFWSVDYDHKVTRSGTYMVLYGPKWAWSATYKVEVDCIDGCVVETKCDSDAQCADGEFCGHNGVVCFAPPCDVSFDVCQPQLKEGEWCQRDRQCGEALACINDKCQLDMPIQIEDCTEDADCTDSFCGCVDAQCTEKVCKPFSQEGESCGGFVQIHHVKHCAPGLACMGPNFIADMPGSCGTPVSVQDLVAAPQKYEGLYVGVQGHIGATVPMCTMMACSMENPCCNSCGSGQRLTDVSAPDAFVDPNGGVGLSQDNEAYRCGGNNCDYMNNCTVENGSYWIGGWFVVGEFDISIDVQRSYAAPQILPTE